MPDGLSTDKFIDVLQDIHTKMDTIQDTIHEEMNTGFKGVYKKMDDIGSTFNHKVVQCESRFANIEKANAVRNGIKCNEKKREEEKIDFWKYIVRSSIVVLTTGMMIVLWKLFVSHIGIIAK